MQWKRGLLLLGCVTTILAQAPVTNRPMMSQMDFITNISKGAEEFSLELFSNVCKTNELIGKKNFMISPFSIWSLLLLVAEGSSGLTLQELQHTLRINNNTLALREGFKQIQKILKVKTTTIELSTMQGIFYNKDHPLNRNFVKVIEQDYEASLYPVDLSKPDQALAQVTKYIETATRGLINPNFDISDFEKSDMVMISSIFFKGQWKLPFNTSFTREEPFYNDDGEVIAQVQMMTQTGIFNYAPIVDMQSHILELPYGKENRLSMLIIVPKKGVRINDAVDRLRNIGLTRIFNELSRREQLMAEYDSDEVEVFLPKFTTTTSLNMNAILENMGIQDVFQPDFADLSKLSSQPIYLSRIIHQAKIEVNEEGTIAAAVSTATFANKASPPRFYLNRPFAYLIVEKTTQSLLFVGQVTKPVYKK